MTAPEPVPVVVGAEGRKWRREVGPTAWVVLEELVAIAVIDASGRWCAPTSIRGLAAELGLGRDSAHQALLRLRAGGLVVFVAPRRPADGRFGAGGYIVGDEIVAALRGAPNPSERKVERSARRAGVAIAHEQLGLAFGDVPAAGEGVDGRCRNLVTGALYGEAAGVEELGRARGLAVSPALEASTGGVGGRRHELASSMPPGAGDVRGDVTGVLYRDGGAC